eukprot:7376919-Prymnesium_polylepis.1
MQCTACEEAPATCSCACRTAAPCGPRATTAGRGSCLTRRWRRHLHVRRPLRRRSSRHRRMKRATSCRPSRRRPSRRQQ